MSAIGDLHDDEISELQQQLEAAKQRELELLEAFHRNMVIAYPEKSHEEISAEIARSCCLQSA